MEDEAARRHLGVVGAAPGSTFPRRRQLCPDPRTRVHAASQHPGFSHSPGDNEERRPAPAGFEAGAEGRGGKMPEGG